MNPQLEERIGAAYAAHANNQRESAERQYRAILLDHPTQVDTLYLLSSLLLPSRPEEADALARRAVEAAAGQGGMGVTQAVLLEHAAATARAAGRPPEAEIEALQQAIADAGPTPETMIRLADAFRRAGRIEEAIGQTRSHLLLWPEDHNARCNLGALLITVGRTGEALAPLHQVLVADPRHFEAHNNLANALRATGNAEEALEHYAQALAIRPHAAAILIAQGRTLLALDRFEPALHSFSQALRAEPASAPALCGAAAAQVALRRQSLALVNALKALAVDSNDDARQLFCRALDQLRIDQLSAETQAAARARAADALRECWITPFEIGLPAWRLVEVRSEVRKLVAAARKAAGSDGRDFLLRATDMIARDPLWRALLETVPVASLACEDVLGALRHQALRDIESGGPMLARCPLAALASVACQFFVSEYLFPLGGEEGEIAARLAQRIETELAAGDVIDARALAVLAMVRPLGGLAHSAKLVELELPAELQALIRLQVSEPLAEKAIKAGLPRLTAIDDGTSQAVRAQYEENPYPRWVVVPAQETFASPEAFLHHAYPHAPLGPPQHSGPFEILIAGCGSGHHSVQVAQRFPQARILAIDLSLTSLAYAARKTAELGVGNVEYAQADLLAIGELGRRFDVIEAGGVLHHLADPFRGWRELLAVLRPGGYMAVGLYSELARAQIAATRELIATRGFADDPAGIRACRALLRGPEHRKRLEEMAASFDYFSMSGCRDLLFHVQETRLRLPQIRDFLAQNGLHLVGINLDPSAQSAYRRRFPADVAITDLDTLDQYEQDNPDTFAGMYQFWVAKPA
jgi:tetratricopeptide (TPR) repeat protein/trans-aconitate methyltransferase